MKEDQGNEEKLRAILQQHGLKKPSEEYSNHLKAVMVSNYRKTAKEMTGYNWIAQVILRIFILWILLFFYFVNPFSVEPVFCISIGAFVLGIWGLIGLMNKIANSFFS